ncbi:MAG: nucleotide-binding protein [Armatimonadetes bacterium]|nr:nucleotide-binding protein [Armatimonadota bacterium]
MTLDDIKTALSGAGYQITSEKRLTNNIGTRLDLNGGAIVNCYDKGSYQIQGRNTERVKEVLGTSSSEPASTMTAKLSKVFVVYGHDRTARDQLEAMLRRWGLEPLVLDQLPSEGQTIIEKLESYTTEVDFGIVLATPDDQGHRAGHPDEIAFRARQNVVLELGMLLAKLGRSKVAILQKQTNMERPSDIQGLIYIPFTDDLQKDAGVILGKEMLKQGYRIDLANL